MWKEAIYFTKKCESYKGGGCYCSECEKCLKCLNVWNCGVFGYDGSLHHCCLALILSVLLHTCLPFLLVKQVLPEIQNWCFLGTALLWIKKRSAHVPIALTCAYKRLLHSHVLSEPFWRCKYNSNQVKVIISTTTMHTTTYPGHSLHQSCSVSITSKWQHLEKKSINVLNDKSVC